MAAQKLSLKMNPIIKLVDLDCYMYNTFLQEIWNFHDQEIRAKTKQNKNNVTKFFWGYKNVNFFSNAFKT